MVIKKHYLLLVATFIMVSSEFYAKRQSYQRKCTTKKDCLNNKKCQCYCSAKGGFRKKMADDKPVYLEDDSNGIHCYCKQWDLDSYPGPVERPTVRNKKKIS